MSKTLYGLPYMGSKNAIVPYLMNSIPSAENFYDLFAGGCAVTHGAMLTHKWQNFIINDLNGKITQLFIDAVNGKFANETRWISREDFFKLKDEEPYIWCCWSFGNRGTTYLYGEYIEPWKKALHYARVFNDYSLLKEMGIESNGSRSDIRKHKKEYAEKYKTWFLKTHNCKQLSKINQIGLENLESLQRLQSLERLESLERLQGLESLERLQGLESLERLQRFNVSYEQVPIKPNSVLYCDIPYENTQGYDAVGEFDHKTFYNWACNQKELVIISSYEISDDRFMEIDFIKKASIMNNTNVEERVYKLEKLFIPKRQKELYEKMMNRKIEVPEHTEQLKLF